MLLSCPNCATSYEVDRTSLGPTGRSVRCLRCRHIWFANNAAAFADIANAHRADVTAFAATTSVSNIASPPPEPPVPYHTNVPSASVDVEATPAVGFVDASQATATVIAAVDVTNAQDAATSTDVADKATTADDNVAPAIDAPTLAPADDGSVPPASNQDAERIIGGDIETVAARRTARLAHRRRTRSLQGLTTSILTLTAIITGLIAWRTDVVRVMPQTASLYAAIGMPVNLRGLEFANVKTATEMQDGVPVLVVAGEIVSRSRRPVELPRLRFAVRNDGGKEIYAWTALPGQAVLAPGAALPFRSRLASPPREGHQVLVRFFNRRDLAAGLQ
jgi:predicted Zn finger-like uncharacterized protein